MKTKLSIIKEIKNHLAKINIGPKKSLGQNFLIEPKVYEDIINALDIKKNDKILEIGAGTGTLTDYILEKLDNSGQIIAIEKDDNFVNVLKNRFSGRKNIKIVHEDILNFKFQISNFQKKYKVVGNIPYYITSRLLKTIFEEWPRPNIIILMVQKEVAKRIVAKAPKSNLLAISVQYFADPKIIRTVGKNNFWPVPEVDSALLYIKMGELRQSKEFNAKFFKIVRAGFSGKRKQLINSLGHALSIPKKDLKIAIEDSGINPPQRAETIRINGWITLAKRKLFKML